MADDAEVQRVTAGLGVAMSLLNPSEKQQLGAIQQEVEAAAAQGGPTYDRKMEFCYAILFNPDVKNHRLRAAAKAYVDAFGGYAQS